MGLNSPEPRAGERVQIKGWGHLAPPACFWDCLRGCKTLRFRLPKDIKLRNADVEVPAREQQHQHSKVRGIAEYVSRLKAAGHRFREAAHMRRRSSLEGGGVKADQPGIYSRGRAPGHYKKPSEATPIGPAVPTIVPSQARPMELQV